MQNETAGTMYRIWGADCVVYGPVELPTLAEWIGDGRVTQQTWVHREAADEWRLAGGVPELKHFFSEESAAPAQIPTAAERAAGVKPGSLRRIKILAQWDEAQLQRFMNFMEVLRFKQFAQVVRRGEHGDAMYLVLSGELRARILIDGKESTLATLAAGEFFGEVSLLDQGPRSADVLANEDSILLKIGAGSFERLMREAPDLAMAFLYNLSRSVVGRMRVLTKRYEDSVHFSRVGGSVQG